MHVTCNFNSNATRKHRDFSHAFSSSFAFRARVKQWLANSHIRALGMSRLSIDAKLQWREREKAGQWAISSSNWLSFDDAAVMTHKTIHKAHAKYQCAHVCVCAREIGVCVCVHYTSQGLTETKSMKRSHESLRAWQQQNLEFVQTRNGFPTHDFLMLIKT